MSAKKPVHEIRYGSIRAAIWSNGSEATRPRFSATFSRTYRTDDSWRDSASFGAADAVALSRVASVAADWMAAHESVSSPASEPV